jgi:tRNA-Thr(GGU) m(6)t(6)A37 methyltransferase TsaA
MKVERTPSGAETTLTLRPIGVVRSPFHEKVSAPRQTAAARDVIGTIELYPLPGMEHAVSDLDACDHLWILFWFHLAHDFRPKVLPPRSSGRRGVLATRSPHRPNPIGLSVVRLDRVEGLTLHVRDIDMLDGTPVLDVKPYVPYADSVPHARVGWLEPPEGAGNESSERAAAPAPADPLRAFDVTFEPPAAAVLAFLKEGFALDLEGPITAVLSLGPQPHPYRRIRKVPGGLLLAVKDWRARFVAEGPHIRVTAIETGYRPKQLVEGVPGMAEAALAPHRAVWERFSVVTGQENS